VLKQRREEVMGRVAAENERVRDAQAAVVNLTQVLSEMEELNAAHPCFTWGITPEPVDTHRSLTASSPVRDEDDPVSEDPSERDRMVVYSEDKDREGAPQ
jgi:hypothetical protein